MSQYRYILFQQKPQSLISKIVAAIIGLIVLIATFVLGAVVLTTFFGFVVVAGIVIYARIWWLKRKYAAGDSSAAGSNTHAGAKPASDDVVLDAEYTVIETHDTDKRDD